MAEGLRLPRDLVIHADDGVRLALRDHGGPGRSLLLMHGLGTHLLSMGALAAELADLRVVTMDLRWSGQSGDSDAYSWDVLVRDVDTVVRALDLQRPVVGGHSWGGMVAVHYAVAHPDAAGVIDLDGLPFAAADLYEGIDPDDVRRHLDSTRPSRSIANMQLVGDEGWLAVTKNLMALVMQAHVADEEIDEHVERMFVDLGGGLWRLHPHPVAYDGADYGMPKEMVAQVACPFLVLNAASLDEVPPDRRPMNAAYRRGLAALLAKLEQDRPNVRVVTLPGASHNSLLSRDVVAVADAIRAFVRGLPVL
jgi:pimeloyl-ACP methyl ester carboxylesterase